MIKTFGLILFGLFTLFTCNTNDTKTIWVNSYNVDCMGMIPMTCLLIADEENLEDSEWEYFYGTINGFDFEPGFIYQLEINETPIANPPADASSVETRLIKVLSKEADMRNSINNIWKLTELRSEDMLFNEEKLNNATLEINSTGEGVTGFGGCNNFGGDATISATDYSISFGPLAMTKMACQDVQTEYPYVSALENVAQYRVDDGQLHLLDAKGHTLMKFRPVD